MNDPKVLQIIAEKACQFDRAHFDDDVPVAVDSLLANHERLPTDRKLITRLRPRYAVALGFFEGYTLAIEDNDELRRERDELQTKLAEAERTGAEHAAQLEDEIRTLVAERDRYKREATESKSVVKLIGYWRDIAQSNTIGEGFRDGLKSCVKDLERAIEEDESKNDPKNIGIVIKPPPPPPPPAAPPAPNELRTEIDDELAQAAADYANDEEGYPTTARDIDEVHDAMKAGKGWYAVARAFVHGARWQLSRIENAHAGDDPTMHFPPAFDRASMPSDREIAELVCRAIYTWREYTDDDIEHVVNVLNCEREDLRRKIVMFSDSTAEACAVKFALLHFRDRIVGPANRSSIPSDEEIARFCVRWIGPHWDSRDLRSAREDLANPEHHVSHATAMRAALDHFGGWSNRPANEVQNAERAQYETTIRQKNERISELEKELALSMETIAATTAQAAEWRDHTELCDYASAEIARNALIRVRNSVDLLPYNLGGVPKSPVMNAIEEELANLKTQEAKHDDGQSVPKKREARIDHVLTTNPGISIAESVRVAQSFDLPNAKISSSLPLPIVFRDDAEIDYWEEMSYVLATKKDTTSQSVATAADEMVEERRKRLSVRIVSENGSRPAIVGVHAADEVTDELLLEAAKFANESELFTSPADKLPPDRELECAKKAMREDCVMTWYRVCRAYVNGALRSSRNP